MNTQNNHNSQAIIKAAPSFDDDNSWTSKSSLHAVELMLQETTSSSLEDKMAFDFAAKGVNDDLFDSILGPLEDFDDTDLHYVKNEALPQVQHHVPENVSCDSSCQGKAAKTVDSDEYSSSLMKGGLLELDVPDLVDSTVAGAAATSDNVMMAGPPDVVSRIMTYLYHTEHDLRIVYKADEIVRECHAYHQRGDHKYKNFPGAVFERFVQLFGGPKFHEIYHRSQITHPALNTPQKASSAFSGPSMLQLAIAYGIHLAKTNINGSDSNMDLVRHGMESLNAMSEKEKHMFWNFIMNQGS